MKSVEPSWNHIGSKRNLITAIAPEDWKGELVTEDANEWGFIGLENKGVIAIGYANLGLEPRVFVMNDCILIGINEVVACFDVNTLQHKFSCRVPFIFHEFIPFGDRIIIRDEIGFVEISKKGDECWRFLTEAPINKFSLEGDRICGETIEGEKFGFLMPSPSRP